MENFREEFRFIGVAGDWHGDTDWAVYAMSQFKERNINHVLHVGDFGFWPGKEGQDYLNAVNKQGELHNITVYVTMGNHEDYVQVATFVPHPLMEGFVYDPNYPNILVAERGARWDWNGVSLVSLGGANSIDFGNLTPNISWWAEEQISLGDIYRTVAGGTADIMVAHDCPDGVDIIDTHRNDDDWSPEALAYAVKSREALRQVVDGVKPGMLLHGHYHAYRDLRTTLNDGSEDYMLHTVGLDMNGHESNLIVMELTTRRYVRLPVSAEKLHG